MKILVPLVCTLSAGLMFYLSQGTHNVWWQTWFASLPILWLAYGPARASIVAAAAFFAFALGQLYLVEMYIGQMPASFMILWVLIFGALFTIAILAARLAQRRLAPFAALFAFPVFWTAIEYLVSLVSPHATFGSIAYSQVSFPAALQIASLFGLFAITFILSLFANALALFIRGYRLPAALGVGIAAAALIFGFVRLAQPQAAPIRVAAMSDQQAARASRHKDTLAASEQMAEEYATAARAAAAKGARIIVTPETGIAETPAWAPSVGAPLSTVAKSTNATLVIGTMGVGPSRNVAMSYAPDGAVRQYDKRHLLYPFEAKFTPGRSSGLLGQGRAVAICKDMDFPATLRADALGAEAANGQDGIRILAVPANDFIADGWLHARMAVLRGVENGFAIVRSASQGLETISDAQGRILARADTDAPGLTEIIADVAPGPGPTLYTRTGDVFSWLMLAASAALLGLSFRRPNA
jgi:apolipoprotein N-acyltransferase